MKCQPGEHDWQPTGRVDVHVDWPSKTKGRIAVVAYYVRCRKCQQLGFRRYGRRVVYTWSPDPDDWETGA